MLHVGPERVGEVRELVHERDPRREHRVRGVLGELGRADVHDQQPIVVAHERRIDRAQRGDRALVLRADHDAVRLHEVVDGRAFLQELRVRRHREPELRAARGELFRNRGTDTVGGPHRHGRLVDDDLELGHAAPDAARRGEHVLHVGRAVFFRRRADGDELQRPVGDGGVGVGREPEAARRPRCVGSASRARARGSGRRPRSASRSSPRRRRRTARRCRPPRGSVPVTSPT